MSKDISVSQLSAYAADPVKFCQHKGRAYNEVAAKKGIEAHNNIGKRTGLPWAYVLVVALIAAIAYMAFMTAGFI